MYAYRTIIYSSQLSNSKLEGAVEIYAANNDTLPEIIEGTNFPDDNGNYIICPQNFYPTSNLENLKYMSKFDSIIISNYLNQDIEFNYTSNFGVNDYIETFKLIGIYKNNNNNLDENICYVQEKTMEEIAINEFSDDLDENGNSNIIYQEDFVIQVDDISNVEKVKNELIDLNYSYSEMATIYYPFFEDIVNSMNIIIFVLSIISLVVIVIIYIKQFNEDSHNLLLLSYLGYNYKNISLIYVFSCIIQSILSLVISLFISIIFVSLLLFLVDIFPFVFNKWNICFNYTVVIYILIIIIIALLISTNFNLMMLQKKERNNKI